MVFPDLHTCTPDDELDGSACSCSRLIRYVSELKGTLIIRVTSGLNELLESDKKQEKGIQYCWMTNAHMQQISRFPGNPRLH